jgi:hypothetical protein
MAKIFFWGGGEPLVTSWSRNCPPSTKTRDFIAVLTKANHRPLCARRIQSTLLYDISILILSNSVGLQQRLYLFPGFHIKTLFVLFHVCHWAYV